MSESDLISIRWQAEPSTDEVDASEHPSIDQFAVLHSEWVKDSWWMAGFIVFTAVLFWLEVEAFGFLFGWSGAIRSVSEWAATRPIAGGAGIGVEVGIVGVISALSVALVVGLKLTDNSAAVLVRLSGWVGGLWLAVAFLASAGLTAGLSQVIHRPSGESVFVLGLAMIGVLVASITSENRARFQLLRDAQQELNRRHADRVNGELGRFGISSPAPWRSVLGGAAVALVGPFVVGLVFGSWLGGLSWDTVLGGQLAVWVLVIVPGYYVFGTFFWKLRSHGKQRLASVARLALVLVLLAVLVMVFLDSRSEFLSAFWGFAVVPPIVAALVMPFFPSVGPVNPFSAIGLLSIVRTPRPKERENDASDDEAPTSRPVAAPSRQDRSGARPQSVVVASVALGGALLAFAAATIYALRRSRAA